MRTYYVDGKFVAADQAVIPVNDLSVLRGYGVCDVMRTYKGRPYFLKEHIARLKYSAGRIGLSLPWSEKKLTGIVLETLEQNQVTDEVNIRIVITGGSSTDFFHPEGDPRLIILITDMPQLPDIWYEKGIKVITHPEKRNQPDAKVLSYIPAAIALQDAKKENAVEALYVNSKKEVLEGTTSNLFAFFGNRLVTPRDGVLKGITRQAVLSLAKGLYTIEERVITLDWLLMADEVFISGTNKCIVPVVQIDDTIIGDGRPGEKTRRIMAEQEKHTSEFIERS